MDNFMLPRLFCQNSEWNLTLIDICWKFTVFPSSPLVIYCFVVVFDYSSLVSPFGVGLSISLSFFLTPVIICCCGEVCFSCRFSCVSIAFHFSCRWHTIILHCVAIARYPGISPLFIFYLP